MTLNPETLSTLRKFKQRAESITDKTPQNNFTVITMKPSISEDIENIEVKENYPEVNLENTVKSTQRSTMTVEDSVSTDTSQGVIQVKENSESTLDGQPVQEPADPFPPSGAPMGAESQDQLRLFVSVLMVKLLSKCHANKSRSEEEYITHIKRLVSQTLEGLHVAENSCPHLRTTKQVCKKILKELEKKFGGRRNLESLIIHQDQAVDEAIVQCFRAHITNPAANERSNRCWWKDVLKGVGFTLILLVGFVLIALIPL